MRDFFSRLGILGELLTFLGRRKLYWLLPMVLVLIIVGIFLLIASNPAIAPFLYPVF